MSASIADVDLARLGDENDEIRRLGLELEGERLERGVLAAIVVGLRRRRAFLHAARVEDRHRPAFALVVVPAPARRSAP